MRRSRKRIQWCLQMPPVARVSCKPMSRSSGNGRLLVSRPWSGLIHLSTSKSLWLRCMMKYMQRCDSRWFQARYPCYPCRWRCRHQKPPASSPPNRKTPSSRITFEFRILCSRTFAPFVVVKPLRTRVCQGRELPRGSCIREQGPGRWGEYTNPNCGWDETLAYVS